MMENNKTSEPKAHEFEAAKEKRPKVVGIFRSLIREQTFSTGKEKGVRNITGDGDVSESLTREKMAEGSRSKLLSWHTMKPNMSCSESPFTVVHKCSMNVLPAP